MDQQPSLALEGRCAMVSSKGEPDGEPPAYSSLASSSVSIVPADLSHPPVWRIVVHEANRFAVSRCSSSEAAGRLKAPTPSTLAADLTRLARTRLRA